MGRHEKSDLLRTVLLLLKAAEPLPWQDWMDGFLRDLERNGGNVSIAIDLCEVSRDTVYRYRRRNQQFARCWETIIQAARPEKEAPRQGARRRLDAADEPQPLQLPSLRRRGPANAWRSMLQGFGLRRRPARGDEERNPGKAGRSRRADSDTES